MAKICWKCQQKIGTFEKKHRFTERENNNVIWIHNRCYLQLTKNELKQIPCDVKSVLSLMYNIPDDKVVDNIKQMNTHFNIHHLKHNKSHCGKDSSFLEKAIKKQKKT